MRGAISIREVANRAGVALGTVSRVINGHPSVSADRRARVLEAISALGYVPDMVAQSMRSRRSMTLACVMRDFTVPTLSLFVDAMQREVEPHGFSTMVASSGHDVTREIALLKGFRQRRIDGLVIASSSERSRTLLAAMRGAGFPIVLIDRRAPAEFDAVGVEHAQGIATAVSYLADLGHRRIAILSGEAGLYPARDRLAGYRAGMARAGIKVHERWVRAASFSPEAGYEQTRALLSLKEHPTAIIAGGSSLLSGVMLAAQEAGLSVPGDLSVIAGADSDLARLSNPGITAVCWPHDVLGRAAGRFLVQRLADASVSRQSLSVRAELVVRGSCAPIAPRSGLTSRPSG